jgi:hypothetical protein
MHVDTIFESRDAIFFEDIFYVKDMRSNAKFSSELAPDFTIPIESPSNHLKKSLRRMTMKFL